MSFRIGLVGLDSSHAEDFLRHINAERRYPDLRVTALHGGDGARVSELVKVDPGLVHVAMLESLIETTDAVIVGHRDGALHRAAAITCLEAGHPVFVDKPLADSRADAEAIVDASERSGAPLLSGSALRWQAETQRLKALLATCDSPVELHAWGTWYPDSEYGGAIFYAVHTVELAQELLGPDFRHVAVHGSTEPSISYRSGRNSVTLSFHSLGASGHSDFGVEIASKEEDRRHPIPLGDDYMLPVVEQFAAMLRTGASPMTRAELTAPLALMEEIDALLTARA
jgi:predicted dehydrogenase